MQKKRESMINFEEWIMYFSLRRDASCNDYYARSIPLPRRDRSVESSRNLVSRQRTGGIEGRGTGPERAYDDSSRRIPFSPSPLLPSFPNERALSPLPSPLPVAPLCFLNEQRTSDQLYRDLLFSERVVILGERVVKQLSGTVVPLIERGHFLESNFIRTIETIEIQKGTEWKYRDFYF